MVIIQSKSKKKPSGARNTTHQKKRLYEKGSNPTLSKIGTLKTRVDRVIGGNEKTRTLQSDVVNVLNPKTKKHTQEKMVSVAENPANRHYVRRNILTKGTIVQLEKGDKAKVTNKPGKEGSVQAILVE